MTEFRVSNDLLCSPDALKSRLLEEGYLFFKGLIEPDRIGELRSEILDLYRQHEWLLAGTNPLEGRVDKSKSCAEGEPLYLELCQRLYGLRSFHAVAHAPELIDTMDKLVDGEVLVHPSKIARMSFPQSERHTTPVHQDFVHFQGSFQTLTCWTPLSDCPVEWDDSFADKGVMDAIAKARAGDEDALYSLDILLKANPGSNWAGEAAETLAVV